MQEGYRPFCLRYRLCKKTFGSFVCAILYARKLSALLFALSTMQESFRLFLFALSSRLQALRAQSMSWPLIILIACIGFALGAALRVLRSRNSDPYANLARDGQVTSAQITEIEASGAWFNVIVKYEVAGTHYTRTLPWPSVNAKPSVGASVQIRYLPASPGLSKLT